MSDWEKTIDVVEVIERLAEYYGIEPESNGRFDLDSYEWVAGCGDGHGRWISLANVVKAIVGDIEFEHYEDRFLDDEEEGDEE